MHFEVLIEDSSGMTLVENVLPKIIGPHGEPHTWRLHSYRGIGRIPKKLSSGADPTKRILLSQLPRILAGYRKTPEIDAVVVILDADRRDCKLLLTELQEVARRQKADRMTTFRLAIEEIEAWYFGDKKALLSAYPRARKNIIDEYRQDSICDTWERLADAIHSGGSVAVKKAGWPLPGQLKQQWAEAISPRMNVDLNQSPSFAKLRDGLRKLAATAD
jgi:hypothetical protein